MKDWLDSVISTGGMKDVYLAISESISLKSFPKVPGLKPIIVPKSIVRDFAFGTFTIVSACHQSLFQVITDEISQNRMATAPDPIPTQHWYSCFTM
jgi:hypothetical protein